MNDCGRVALSNLRVVLFGSEGGFSRPVFEQLLARGISIAAVVMVEMSTDARDFPVDIRQAVRPDGLEDTARRNKVAVLKTHSLNDENFVKQLTNKQADLFLVACFEQKIPDHISRKMNLPCWNLHPSLLPKYRGPSPLYWQLKNEETETGVTIHEVTRRVDAGHIVARQSAPLPAEHDDHSLNQWVAKQGIKLFHQALVRYADGDLEPVPQDETMASYYPLRSDDDQ